MSSDSPDQEQSTKKSKKDEDETSKNTTLSETETELPASTSKSFEAERKKAKSQEKNEKLGFFPQNMWFWKQEEPQQEVQIKNWSTTSQHSINNKNSTLQQSARINTESQYIWPDALNIQEPQRLVNQPTLDQIIEQRKLRENQLVFAQEFSKHVDYLGDRMSKTKLNILIAQLNKLLPSSSEETLDATQKLSRAKPLKISSSQQVHRKPSKVTEQLTPEEIAQREQTRQNQLEEYDNLRDQINLFEERSSPRLFNTSNTTSNENRGHVIDETISKTDLNKLIDLLNEMPNAPKENMTASLQELITRKPQILEIVKQAFRNKAERLSPEEIKEQEQLRQTQLNEIENVRDQIALYEDRSVPMNIPTADNNMKKLSHSVLEETISRSRLKNLVTQLNEPESYEKPPSSRLLFRWRTSEQLTPEERARREELRQNQLQEYETLREQIGLFGERKSDVSIQERKEIILEKSVSKKELNLFFNELNDMPAYLKNKQKAFTPSKSS